MVTDAAVGGARTETVIPYGARLVVTVLLLGLYVVGHLVPLPFINPDAHWWSKMSPLDLGLTPLLVGFTLVELFSLVTSPGRRLRKSGAAGRARLNRAALAASLLLAAFQATGIVIQLEKISGIYAGVPLVTAPGLTFRLLTIATLTAATAAVFIIGQLLSTYGIGNGFALLMLAQMGWMMAANWIIRRAQGSYSFQVPQGGLVVTAGMVILVFLYIRRADTEWLPAFPQSALLVYWTLYPLVLLPFWLQRLNVSAETSAILHFVAALILIPLLSWLGFHLFSSRARLAANLPETGKVLGDIASSLRRQTFFATAVLTVGTAAELVWRHYWPSPLILPFVYILSMAAIAQDLWDQFQFQRQKGATALLVQLDNVHFSYRLEERLQEEGIDALARGHVFRSLYFFLGPLFKIDVLVARKQLPRAREVLAELEAAAEVRVF